MFGPELIEAFREFKAIWDPGNKMNPGIKVEPLYKLDQDLRTGPDYRPAQPETFFRYPDDAGSFAYATERCIGVGTCRKEESGTMCPSYMATREEMHSTRGRSRLLFEMLRGDVLDGGWRDEHVHDALDLCLACKGCKSECPNNVDMASYKAEFFAHYYAGRLRPRAAYAMGLIPYWARLGSLMPEVVNALMNAPGLGDLIKMLGGISTRRHPPAFAPATFKSWFRRRGTGRATGPAVILWADTFNNHFHPEVAKAAVEVLEDAGFRLIVPMASLCCGRPLYDFGMLATARRFLRRILEALREPIRAGIPVVVLEPGCASVFRDELGSLFPNDRDARRLRKQTLTLAEFLIKAIPDYQPPQLRRKALVHAHCHHKSVMTTDAEEQVLQRLGLDYGKMLDAGCCGMAGSFGFEANKYEISMQIGEQRLLPAVRAAARDTLIVADGFSCKHQIQEGTDRQALHLAQVLQMALHEAPDGPLGGYPEVLYPDVRLRGPERLQTTLRTASVLGVGALLAGGAAYALARRRST
jgi:Fe-S oxidoreductase